MQALLLGIAVLFVSLWALSLLTKIGAGKLARALRIIGGIATLALAIFLALRGQLAVAIPLGIAGLSLLGWSPTSGIIRRAKTPGQVSRVRSAFVEIELDHRSGAMTGRILAGPFEGVPLEALDAATLAAQLPDIDGDSGALLVAYLDRRHPRWRENAQADTAAGQSEPPRPGKMTEEEAYQILGVQPGAGAKAIGRAHRTLMKKLHPDQGGTTYLAARVNEARDLLLRRHR